MSSVNKKQRVNSVHNSASKRVKSIRQPTPNTESASNNQSSKHKRNKRIVSQLVKPTKTQIKNSNKKAKITNPQTSTHQPLQAETNSQPNPHLLTVADLQSDRESSPENKRQTTHSPMHSYKQQSTIKLEDAGVQAEKSKVTLPLELQKKLDQTIQKLKSKQESIDILNRTIQTRLVEPNEFKLTGSRRIDVYEVQINFYVQKITELQKELHQKNKVVANLTQKNIEFNTVVKNNRKLIGQNHRLKQQRQLFERQNAALKKLLLKKAAKSY